MLLVNYGINHKTTPLSLRERLAFNRDQAQHALGDFLNQQAANEAILLSTCNRTELYAIGGQLEPLQDWLFQYKQIDRSSFQSHFYYHRGIDAIKHLMRVATGLDSLLLGEPQILGQVKQAYEQADQLGAIGPRFRQLFPAIFSASKTIRHRSTLAAKSTSLAHIVLKQAKRIVGPLNHCHVLLVGVGEVITDTVPYLLSEGVTRITVANRTIAKGAELADQLKAQAIRIGDIPQMLAEVDIIITGTASQLPIIGKGMLESAIKQRTHRPLFIADLAVPRDVEPEAVSLDNVYLSSLDTLEETIAQHRQYLKQAAQDAEILIEQEAEHFLKQCRVQDAGQLIGRFRETVKINCEQALSQAIAKLTEQQDPRTVLAALAHQLIHKMARHPLTLQVLDSDNWQDYLEQLEVLSNHELSAAFARMDQGQVLATICQRLVRNLSHKILHWPTEQLRRAAYHQQAEVLALADALC